MDYSKQSGFTLIECTVYLAGLLTLIYLVSSFTQSIVTSMLHHIGEQREAVQIEHALQLLARDVHMAQYEQSTWHIDSHRLVMQHHDENIGWELRKGCLYRIRGTFKSNSWTHIIHKMPVATTQDFTFEVCTEDNNVRSVQLIKPTKRTLVVKNGPT